MWWWTVFRSYLYDIAIICPIYIIPTLRMIMMLLCWIYTENRYNTIHMYSGITSGRVPNGELLYTKILEVNLFAFAYRLFRRDFSPLDRTYCIILQYVLSSGEKSLRNSLQANANKLTSRIFVRIDICRFIQY